MKKMRLPDLPSVDTPDLGGVADDLMDLASAAADAVSSAAGNVPGLEDYRAAARRKRLVMSIGAIAVVLVVFALIRRRQSSDDTATS